MIRYTLACENQHRFESWFQNAAAFDSLVSSGHVKCINCGSGKITKTLMAPAITPTATPPATLDKLRTEVETNSDYVGLSFAQEARDMHDGLIPTRSIYGEAKLDEAKKLVEEGVPVMPLPFVPTKKAN